MHPGFITGFIWALLITLYQSVEHGLYPISGMTYSAIGIWATLFSLFAYTFAKVKFSIPPFLKYSSINPIFKSNYAIYAYVIIMMILIILQYRIGSSVNSDNQVAGMREALGDSEQNVPVYYSVLNRFETFIYVIFWGLILTAYRKKYHNFKLIAALGLLLLLYTFLLATKGKLIELYLVMLSILYFKGRLKFKYILLPIAVIIPIIAAVITLRDQSNYSFEDLAIIYSLSPLTALDTGLGYSAFQPTNNMWYTFRMFYTILDYFNIDTQISTPGNAIFGWQMVPYPTNVYSIIYNYYMDLGWSGIIIMAIIMGSFWGIIYNGAKKKNDAFILMYSIMYYMLIFQFFGDWFFNMLSMNLQIMLFCCLIFLRFKNPFKNNENDRAKGKSCSPSLHI